MAHSNENKRMAQSPMGPIDVVATNHVFCDPAIDTEQPLNADGTPNTEANDYDAMIAAYRKDRDISLLRVRPGMALTKFHCKPLPHVYVGMSLDFIDVERMRVRLAFMASCHSITRGDGTKLFSPENKLQPIHNSGVKSAPDAWFDEVAGEFGTATIQEIGQVIYERARLPKNAKGPFSYRLG